MTILFVIKSVKHFSYLSSIISALDDMGHQVPMLFDKTWSNNSSFNQVDEFLKYARYSCWQWSEQRHDKYRTSLFKLREARSYLSYLRRKVGSDFYRKRWAKYAPKWAVLFGPVLKYGYKYFVEIENKFPPAENIIEDLKRINPDVVVVSPANHRFSEEIEYIKAAKHLNIPTVISVLSWDNLTTKGVFHVLPDRLLVWNNFQKSEAIQIHGINPENITITGAPFFDKWKLRDHLKETRFNFCNRVGVNPFKNFMLYLGSSKNVAKDETWIISAITDLFPDLNILVRPHPANYKIYRKLNHKNVSVYPKKGALPESRYDRSDFYNSLKHCTFAFGINTSGMIDALINEIPVVTLLANEYSHTQKEAIHYKYMQSALYECESIDELVKTFNLLLHNKDTMHIERENFVSRFIRQDAGKLAAEAIINESSYCRSRGRLGQSAQHQI